LETFGPKMQEVIRGWKGPHNEEIRKSPNIITMIKSWTMKLVGHIARMNEIKYIYKSFVRKPERKRPL